jgi:hypothetical protein
MWQVQHQMPPATHVVLRVVSVNAVRFKSKCECRERHILLNYACTEFNEIRSVVLSCYAQIYGRTDRQTQEGYKMRLRNVTFRWKV